MSCLLMGCCSNIFWEANSPHELFLRDTQKEVGLHTSPKDFETDFHCMQSFLKIDAVR